MCYTLHARHALRPIVMAVSFAASGFTAPYALATDTDDDGMSDAYERAFGLDAQHPDDARFHDDEDLLSNVQEAQRWTDPFVSDTDGDGWHDHRDAEPLSRAVMHWADPTFTAGSVYMYTGPDWFLHAEKQGGSWGAKGWHATTTAQALLLHLDRPSLPDRDLRMDIAYTLLRPRSTLHMDLLDRAGNPLIHDALGNVLPPEASLHRTTVDVPLRGYPGAATVRIRLGKGSVTVHRTQLYIDEDRDNLDSGQEAQIGSNPHVHDMVVIGEWGITHIECEATERWHTITFCHRYRHPVVIMQSTPPGHAGSRTIRLRNVKPQSFEFRIDGDTCPADTHGGKNLGYVAMESGIHTLADGSIIEAGHQTDSDARPIKGRENHFSVPPIRLTQWQTPGHASASVTGGGIHSRSPPTLGHIAMEANKGKSLGLQYQAGRIDACSLRTSPTTPSAQPFGNLPVIFTTVAQGPDAPNSPTRSYIALGGVGTIQIPTANMERDTDSDGMPDAWERARFGTLDRVGTGDFDGDGIPDRQEFLRRTDPSDASSRSATICVNSRIGNDGFDGRTHAIEGNRCGPKATIAAAVAIARSGDTIEIAEGRYEKTLLRAEGRHLRLRAIGRIQVR